MTDPLRDSINVIPYPAKITPVDGTFTLSALTSVVIAPGATAGSSAAQYLRERLEAADFQIAPSRHAASSSVTFDESIADHGVEGYELTVAEQGITIAATAAAGFFYGVQTLLPMLAPLQPGAAIRCVQIVDRPRFKWRGLMLDVSRHLMPVDGILKTLDEMAAHKLNVFHWHLTDDHGWRLQINAFPVLTAIGAWRKGDGGPLLPEAEMTVPPDGQYGGFYTQDDVRTIVAYAAERHITIVPEIELPGHALAALSAYPELSCTGGPFAPATHLGIFKDVFCPGNEATYALLEQVLDEVLALFPGQYIHIGGDECPRDRWKLCPKCQALLTAKDFRDEGQLQQYMVRRISDYLQSRGRRVIGWDEVLDDELSTDVTVMAWRGVEIGTRAARQGHDVVLTPTTHCYLDYRQHANGEPPAIGDTVISLETAYGFDPTLNGLSSEEARHVLGVQGNLWTEYMTDLAHVEYMTWPRASAIAEIGWSPAGQHTFSHFLRRVEVDEKRLAERGTRFRPVARQRIELTHFETSLTHRRPVIRS